MVDKTRTAWPNSENVQEKFIDMLDGTHALRQIAQPPPFLMTGTTNRRIRVDVGESSFFEGRQFRTFREFSVAAATTLVVKAVVPVNIILYGLGISMNSGEMKLFTMAGGTEGGTFSETLPIFPRNTMTERPTPLYTPVVVLTAGGTHTGGTALDELWIKTADNSNFAGSVGTIAGDERGVGPGTYYFLLTGITGTSTGVFRARWEERLPL